MKANQVLSSDEIATLTAASNWRGALSVATTWAIVAATLALVARWPSMLTAILALVLLGGRQLALAILTHECAHRSLFRSRAANVLVGKWLAGSPIWLDCERYRAEHIAHHAHAGTPRDPDLALSSGFPVRKGSMARKLARDLLGLTGLRRVAALVLMDAGIVQFTAGKNVTKTPSPRSVPRAMTRLVKNIWPVLLTNGLLAAVLWACGSLWVYALWVAAYLTTYSAFLRVRSIAEHACTEQHSDPVRHTRTIVASPLARLTVAPHHVNYHTEHHLLPTVPHYRLPGLHRRLRAAGVFENGHLARSYGEVLALATR